MCKLSVLLLACCIVYDYELYFFTGVGDKISTEIFGSDCESSEQRQIHHKSQDHQLHEAIPGRARVP